MPAIVTNPFGSPLTLPPPLDIILAPGEGMVFATDVDGLIEDLGGLDRVKALGLNVAVAREGGIIRSTEPTTPGIVTAEAFRSPTATPAATLPEQVIYVRTGGNDANDGSTAALAVATLERAMALVPIQFEDRRYIIDLTGCTLTVAGIASIASRMSSIGWWQNFDETAGDYFDADLMAFPGDYYRGALTFRAEPTDLYTGIDVTAQAADAVTGMYTYTTDGDFDADELKGKLLYGSGFAEVAVIVSNTAGPNSEIYCAFSFPMTAPVRVADYSAVLTLGDATEQDNFPNDSAFACSVQFQGIKFVKAPETIDFLLGAINITTPLVCNFTQCEIQGANFRGGGSTLIEDCYLYGPDGTQFLGAFNCSTYLRYTYVRSLKDGVHGDGGGGTNRGWCVFEECNPWGHGGTSEPVFPWNFDNCDFIDPVTSALYYRGGIHCRFKDSTVNGGDRALLTEHVGSITVDNVRGTTDHEGIRLAAGVQLTLANMASATGVKGADGEIELGTSGAYLTYDAAPTVPFFGEITSHGIRLAGPTVLDEVTVLSASNHIAIDASRGSSFFHDATENTTLDNFTNLRVGMRIEVILKQHAGAAKTLAYGTYFNFGSAPAPDFSLVGLSKHLVLSCIVRSVGAGGVFVTAAGGF